jgi:hypothetical protein
MVKETGKSMAEQLHKVAEEASNHVSKNTFCCEILYKCFLYSLPQVSLETETSHLIK